MVRSSEVWMDIYRDMQMIVTSSCCATWCCRRRIVFEIKKIPTLLDNSWHDWNIINAYVCWKEKRGGEMKDFKIDASRSQQEATSERESREPREIDRCIMNILYVPVPCKHSLLKIASTSRNKLPRYQILYTQTLQNVAPKRSPCSCSFKHWRLHFHPLQNGSFLHPPTATDTSNSIHQ